MALDIANEKNSHEIYTPGLEQYAQRGVFLLSFIQVFNDFHQ